MLSINQNRVASTPPGRRRTAARCWREVVHLARRAVVDRRLLGIFKRSLPLIQRSHTTDATVKFARCRSIFGDLRPTACPKTFSRLLPQPHGTLPAQVQLTS
jgi:hypothetical protein